MVTPLIGKPVEVNALWYNALCVMAEFARLLGEAPERYEALAEQARAGFARFWNEETGYCYDVLDGPGENLQRLATRCNLCGVDLMCVE